MLHAGEELAIRTEELAILYAEEELAIRTEELAILHAKVWLHAGEGLSPPLLPPDNRERGRM